MVSFHIDFEPIGQRGRCNAERSLLDCAHQLGLGLISLCGGEGACGRCKLRVIEGHTSELTSDEMVSLSTQELDAGYRLACQTYPLGDCKIYVPPESLTAPQRTQVEGLQVDISPDPVVAIYPVDMTSPTLQNYEADDERLFAALRAQHDIGCRTIDIRVSQELSPSLRSCNWQFQASVRSDEIVAISPKLGRHLGLAIDLGTTKIAGYLLDLSTGKILASQGIMNPQIAYGEDVISRLSHAIGSQTGSEQLQKLAASALSEMASSLSAKIGAAPLEIVEAVVVGNTAMHHLLLGLPVEQLAMSPYVPAVRRAQDIKARDLGIDIAPAGYIHLLPNIAGFVGADHVAMLLATGIRQRNGVVLALDIGTNTELCLSYDGVMASVSCASGPAFEGAHIKYGMRASEGAIEHLRITGDGIEYQTIGGVPPTGLCGSGIIDAIAQLYLANVLDDHGRMNPVHHRVLIRGKEREFVLVSEEDGKGVAPITITQADIREVQLAKGAIRTGIQVLLDASSRSEEDIREVIIAGAFGSYIDVASAVTVGLLPALPADRFKQVGNAAGTGAIMALISRHMRKEAQDIADRVRYVELATTPEFSHTFALANYLGTYRIVRGKRQPIQIWKPS